MSAYEIKSYLKWSNVIFVICHLYTQPDLLHELGSNLTLEDFSLISDSDSRGDLKFLEYFTVVVYCCCSCDNFTCERQIVIVTGVTVAEDHQMCEAANV